MQLMLEQFIKVRKADYIWEAMKVEVNDMKALIKAIWMICLGSTSLQSI